jgi:hypothetical protein
MARRRRRLVIVLSMAALLGLTLAAVMVARSARSPGQIASSATPPGPSTVTVPVTAEPHTLTAVATGSVSEQVVARLATPQSPAAEGALPVLTKVLVSAGDSFSLGDVVAEISGRPLIVLPGRFPLYRDIHRGDTGPDVLQLRRGLAAVGLTRQAGSTWDASAEQALGQLYASRGYAVAEDLVGGRGATAPTAGSGQATEPAPSPARAVPVERMVRRAEFVFAPSVVGGVYCGVRARVGSTADGVLAEVCSGDLRFEGVVEDNGQTDLLPAEGKSGTGRLSGQTGPGRIVRWTRIGAAAKGKEGLAPRFRATKISRGEIDSGERARLTITLATSRESDLVVPVSALWTRDGVVGVYAGPAGERWTPVQVRFSVDGRAVVRAGALHQGDAVALTSPAAIRDAGA